MQRALSLEDTPALSVPLRFLLAAPWFGAAAGALLLWQGAAALTTRWAPSTVALTHLMTLGFLGMTMAGAVLQMLPVVAGFAVPRVRLVAGTAWMGVLCGTPMLAAALLTGLQRLFMAAAIVLGAALLVFIAALAAALRQRASHGALPMVAGMRFALAGLAAAAAFGLALASYFAGLVTLPLVLAVNLHAALGLLGWIAMLVIGVAFQVIPMFQGTATYPRAISLALPCSLALLLAAWGVAMWMDAGWHSWIGGAIGATVGLFAATSLYLLSRRKRKTPDVTTAYWRLSLGSLLACVALYLWHADADWHPLLLGILFIAGFASSAVNSMLYKIVPFLLWYHLAQAGLPRSAVPGVNGWIADRAARSQFRCHSAALAALVAAPFVPQLARPAGVLFAAGMAWLGVLLMRAALRYRRLLAASGRESA